MRQCPAWELVKVGVREAAAAARASKRAQLCLLIFPTFRLHFPSAMQCSIHL